jgi:hypothetical protein
MFNHAIGYQRGVWMLKRGNRGIRTRRIKSSNGNVAEFYAKLPVLSKLQVYAQSVLAFLLAGFGVSMVKDNLDAYYTVNKQHPMEFKSIENKLDLLNVRFDKIDERFDKNDKKSDEKFDKIDKRFEKIDLKISLLFVTQVVTIFIILNKK